MELNRKYNQTRPLLTMRYLNKKFSYMQLLCIYMYLACVHQLLCICQKDTLVGFFNRMFYVVKGTLQY